MPGVMRTTSTPAASNTGHRRSANTAAANNAASDTRGTHRLAAKPKAKCPINMLCRGGLLAPLHAAFLFQYVTGRQHLVRIHAHDQIHDLIAGDLGKPVR